MATVILTDREVQLTVRAVELYIPRRKEPSVKAELQAILDKINAAMARG